MQNKDEFKYYVLHETKQHHSVRIRKIDENKVYLECINRKEKLPETDFIFPGGHICVKQKIIDALNALEIEGIKYIPTKLISRKDQTLTSEYSDYFYIDLEENSYSTVVETEESDVIHEAGDKFIEIKLVLKTDELKKIPLNKRLVFYDTVTDNVLFHKLAADIIKALKPQGVAFKDAQNLVVDTEYLDDEDDDWDDDEENEDRRLMIDITIKNGANLDKIVRLNLIRAIREICSLSLSDIKEKIIQGISIPVAHYVYPDDEFLDFLQENNIDAVINYDD